MSIKENIEKIEKNIALAAQKSGRKREDILLLAVTKTVEIERMEEAKQLGLTQFGENKPQEISRKYPLIDGVKWHQIGHLQTNKVKNVIDKVCLIHSVDSIKLGNEISKRAQALGIVSNVLVEVNIARDEAKHGVDPNETVTIVTQLSKLPSICVKGLMTVAPYTPDPEENRKYFREMYKLYIDIGAKKYDNVSMEYLSMGMTNDYIVAIEEGANIVRIGTGIFGQRDYTKIG